MSTPPPRGMSPIWVPPAAAWRRCTTSACSPSRPAAGTGCTTCSASTPGPWLPPRLTPPWAASWTTTSTPPPPHPAAAPDLTDRTRARAWARAERASLLACLDHATRTGQHARVLALTAGIADLLRRDGPRADATPRHTAALE